jgi:hypothetical protein
MARVKTSGRKSDVFGKSLRSFLLLGFKRSGKLQFYRVVLFRIRRVGKYPLNSFKSSSSGNGARLTAKQQFVKARRVTRRPLTEDHS